MPQKIENKDIFSSDFLEPQKKSFKEIIELIKLMEKEMKDVLKVQQQLVKSSDKKSVQGLKKRQRAVQSVNQVSKEMLRLEKQRKSVSSQLALAETKEARAVQSTRIELARKKKAVKDEIMAEKGLVSEYTKQSKHLNNLRKKYKDLILVQGKETRTTRKLRREIGLLDRKLKKVDATTGQFQRNVGNYPGMLGKASNALRSMGLAFAGLAIIRNIFKTVKEFNQSMANLSSITGATGKDLDFFKQKAIDLGSSTTLSAGQVAEGFKLIASAKPELLEDAAALALVTEQAIILAEAAGIDLPTAAQSLALSLNQFGAGADEASKFIDVLAAGSKKGAGDITFLNGALLKVGGTAEAAGLSFVDTVAVLETLAPVLGSGEEAGTKMRNILASLQKEGLGFASGQFNINDALAETNEMLNAIQDPAAKAAARIKLFGKQNDAAGIQLLKNTHTLKDFQVTLDENGIALEQQKTNNDTLQGSIKALSSAWEGIVLSFENGTGVFAGLKEVLFSLARNLSTIFKWITVATTAFITYKVVINAGTVAMNIYKAATAAFGIVQAILTGNTKNATAAMKLFNIAVKLSPIGLLVSVLAAAVTAYALFADHTTLAEKSQKAFNEGLEEGAEDAKKLVDELALLGDEERRLIRLRERAGEITGEEASKERLKILEKEKIALAAAFNEQDDLRDAEQLALDERIKNIKKSGAEEINNLIDLGNQTLLEKLFVKSATSLFDKTIEKELIEKETLASKKRQGDIQIRINEIGIEYDAKQKAIDEANAEILGKEKEFQEDLTDEQKKGQEKRAKELGLYLIRLQDLQDEAIVSGFKRENAQLKRKFKRNFDAIKGNSQVEIDLRKALEDELQKSLEEVREKYERQEEAQRKEDNDKKKKYREEQNDEALAIDQEYFDEILDKQKKQLEIRAKTEEVAASEFLDLELDRLIAELELLELYGKDTTDQLQKIADKKHQIHLANLDELKKADKIEAKRIADELAKRKKQQEEQLTALRSFAQKAIQISNAKTDKEIANIDKELAANKTRQDELQTLAAQGNLTAEQSVSAEIKRELELERQKEALEKKKARRQIILEGLDLLSSKIDGGEKDAVTSTLNDMTRLLGALAALPGFIDGTETTVGAALGKPQLSTGTDDYIVRVDGSEKILNPGMSARTGNMTTEEITRAAEMYSSGMFDQNVLIHPQVNALSQPFQGSTEILKKFDSLESTIRNKPILSDLKFDDLQKALIVTVEQNGDLKRAHYKLK
jgi:TP901 family phage tail tape measure protein